MLDKLKKILKQLNESANTELITESVQTEITALFEAAVKEKTVASLASEKEKLVLESKKELEDFKRKTEENIDRYFKHVTDEYMTENAVAIETGAKAEYSQKLLESVISAFSTNGIRINESTSGEANEVKTLGEKVTELKKALNEAEERSETNRQALVAERAVSIFMTETAHLPTKLRNRAKLLAEDFDIDNTEEFRTKLQAIVEALEDAAAPDEEELDGKETPKGPVSEEGKEEEVASEDEPKEEVKEEEPAAESKCGEEGSEEEVACDPEEEVCAEEGTEEGSETEPEEEVPAAEEDDEEFVNAIDYSTMDGSAEEDGEYDYSDEEEIEISDEPVGEGDDSEEEEEIKISDEPVGEGDDEDEVTDEEKIVTEKKTSLTPSQRQALLESGKKGKMKETKGTFIKESVESKKQSDNDDVKRWASYL